MAEDAHGPVLHRYGFSEISLRDALLSTLRDGAPAALNETLCEYLATRWYLDRARAPAPPGPSAPLLRPCSAHGE